MTAGPAIRFDDVTLGYGRRPAVHHLDGAIAAGSLTAVVGPNGAGKSTLLKGVVGTLKPVAGHIHVSEARKGVAYLPQAAELDRSFPLAVYDLVAMGLWARSGIFGGIGRADRTRIEEAVVAVLHDMELVRRVFPDTLLIAREPIAWGATAAVLRPENLLDARRMMEAHDPHAAVCAA